MSCLLIQTDSILYYSTGLMTLGKAFVVSLHCENSLTSAAPTP